MRCDYAFLCDAAQPSLDGRFNALGIGLANIYAPAVPAMHPQMVFAACISGSAAEAGGKQIALRLMDADGGDVVPPLEDTSQLVVQSGATEGRLLVVLVMNGVQFEKRNDKLGA